MRRVRLGASELEVSVVALGCGNFGGIGSDPALFGRGETEDEAFALLDTAREAGITLLDTANSYGGGRSEEWLGRWLTSRGCRDEMVLTTKVGNRVGPDPDDQGLSAKHIRAQVEASLRRLGTDRIDLYLSHQPDPTAPVGETLAAFDDLIRGGLVRAVGLSNYDADQLAEAVDTGPARVTNLQSSYSLLERANAATFDLCARHGIAFTAFSPLAGGWLARDYRPNRPYPEGSRMTLRPEPYRNMERQDVHDGLAALRAEADQRGVSLPTLALAWVLSDPGVTGVVVGPRRPDQLTPALAALDLPLAAEERAALASLVPNVQ